MNATARRLTLAATVLVTALSAAAPASATAWVYTEDDAHSEVSFRVRHIVTKVRGDFRDFDLRIVRDDEDPSASSVEFTARVASIDTENEKRDNHLRSADFFDVEAFPLMTFKSTSVEQVSDTEYSVTGDLTIRDVTKSVTLPVSFSGDIADAQGRVKAGFSASTRIDRREYGVTWNRPVDSGGLLLGDDVEITIEIEARREG